MKITQAISLASFVVLVGCGVSSKTQVLSSNAPMVTSVGSISFSIAPAVRKRMEDNPGFQEAQLHTTIKDDLTRRKLLLPKSTQTLDVNVTDLRVRPGVAVYFGSVFSGKDFVVADVTVKDAEGKTLKSSNVNVTFGLAGWGSLGTAARNAQMYETFARHVAAVVDPSIPLE